LPNKNPLALEVQRIVDLAIRRDHLLKMLNGSLRGSVEDILKDLVLRDSREGEDPVVRGVKLEKLLIVPLGSGSPASMELVLSHDGGEELGVQVPKHPGGHNSGSGSLLLERLGQQLHFSKLKYRITVLNIKL